MRICVGITGSIAAYRSPDLVKELSRAGHEVSVVLTRAAKALVSERVLSTFATHPVLSDDTFGADHRGTDHIETARWAEIFVVYAASADFIARHANGLADDFLALQLLATRAPVIFVPGMNPAMWEHPAVVENVRRLRERGVRFVGPIPGLVACGETGVGHIAENSDVMDCVRQAVAFDPLSATGSLAGRRLLISAGPMQAAVDAVRFLQNRSSGLFGLEIARAAQKAGASVHVLLGPVESDMRRAFTQAFPVTPYVTASEYGAGLDGQFADCDAFLSLAAVLDFEPIPRDGKIDRGRLSQQSSLEMEIRPVPDFVARMAERKRPDQRVIAFAAEAGSEAQILERAAQKLRKKKTDAVVANPLWPDRGPHSVLNEVWIVSPGDAPQHLGPLPKSELAPQLLHALGGELSAAR